MSDAPSTSSVSGAESTSSKKNLPNQPANPGAVEDFAAISIEHCRGWLRNYRLPYDWPAEEVVAHCLLGRLNCGRRRPYCTRSEFDRCQELLRYPVNELQQILGSHGFVAKKPNKTSIVTRILRAERHESKRAKKANERRLKALREPEIYKGSTDVYSTDEEKEDDGDDTSSDESFSWTEDQNRYIEVPITESGDSEGAEVEVEDDEDEEAEDEDDDEATSEEGEELSTSRPVDPRAARPTTAGKAPVASTRPLKRARTPDDEADYEIDPPSPKRMRAASSSSAATSRSDSDDEEVDHDFAEDPLASLFTETPTGIRKRKREEDVISVSDGDERSPKRIHSASGSETSGASTTSQRDIVKRTRCDRLNSKSPRKARSSESLHAPVANGMARKESKASEEVITSSGVTYTPVADGIARLKPIKEQLTSSGVAFIPVAEGFARLAPVGAKPETYTKTYESSKPDAQSTDAIVEETGEDRSEEHGYDGEDEADANHRDKQDGNDTLEEGEYQHSSRCHSKSPVASPEEVASLPAPATKSKAHGTKHARKKPFNPDDSVGTAINCLKRKRAEKLADSGSDSDEPLFTKRKKVQRAADAGPSNAASTNSRLTSQAHGNAQNSNPTLSQKLQQQSHNMIIDGVDTRVLFENKKVPTTILNAMLRIMMGCAEENDVADVHQCRKNLPGYRAYLEGTMRAAPDEDNDWLTVQKFYELREMEAMLTWKSESETGD